MSSTTNGRRLMEEWLNQSFDTVSIKRGDILQGAIVSITETEILVDVGCKADGIISGRELERMAPEELSQIRVGDRAPVFVVSPEDRDGNILLSLTRARSMRDWTVAEELFNSEEIFEGRVSGCNKGGLIVNIGRLRGFVPASQLTPGAYEKPGDEKKRDQDDRWEHLLGEELKLKVIEIDRERNRLILSEKAAAREGKQSAKLKLLNRLQVGDVCKGVVSGLCDFGAFVDLGGADGLIHLSELSWNRVQHPGEVVKEGQAVEVYVVEVDHEKQRIGLSLRRLSEEPKDNFGEAFAVGQMVEGTITKIVSFGAFALVGESVEGLIHISELADYRVNHPREVVREGDQVTLKVIRIDPERRRIGLSLVQAQDMSELDWRKELEENPEKDEPTQIT